MMFIKDRMIFTSFILTLIAASMQNVDSSDVCTEGSPTITSVVNTLASQLDELIEKNENYFFSPLSISVALAMVYIGARGTTREQMTEALDLEGFGHNCLPNKISENFRNLILSLKSENENYSFLIANGAFIQIGYNISQYYSSSLKKNFNSEIKYLDFARRGEVSMNTINEWVSKNTKGKIAEILNEPLDPLTVLVLINAVYFKGIWELEFNEEFSINSTFYGINKSRKRIEFMEMEDEVNYYFDPETEYSYLELDYKGDDISMIIILPKSHEEPKYFLTTQLLCFLRNNFEKTIVEISLPKFSMDFDRELSKDMARLHMDELFSDRADLTGIREETDLHVSAMVHKAVIEVNEKGSIASAATGMRIDGRQKVSQKAQFLANHPFSFYIVHRETDTILFAGRILSM